VPTDRLVRLAIPKPRVAEGVLETVITHVLIFGNVTFAATEADLRAALGPLTLGQALAVEFAADDKHPAVREATTWVRTFGDVARGASLLMVDSEGQLSLADNQGDAAARLGLAIDRAARITAA
jgi:S-adenosylmethionine hydrolase